MTMNPIHNIQREVYYDLTLAIDVETTYCRTYPNSGVGYAWRYEEAHPQLARLAERAIREKTDATLVDLEIEPGYLRAQAAPDSYNGTRPKDVVSACNQLAGAWNNMYGTQVAGKTLDGIRFGDRFFEVARPVDVTTPETFIEDRCTPDPEGLPDAAPAAGDGPVFELGPGVEWDIKTEDRHIPVTAIVPIDLDTFDLVEAVGYDDEVWSYEWDSVAVEQFENFTRKYAWNGDGWRLSVHPYYLRIDLLSGSMSRTPADATVAELEALVSKFNNNRQPLDVELAGPEVALRPELQLGDVAYVGASTTEGVTDEWIASNGLDDVDGEPFDPEPEPEPVPDGGDDGEDDGGLMESIGRPWRTNGST